MAKAMTAKQRAALRKAQLASAAKRRGTGRGRPVSTKQRRNNAKMAMQASSDKRAAARKKRESKNKKGHFARNAGAYGAAAAVAVGVGVAYAQHELSKAGDKKDKGKGTPKRNMKARKAARKRLDAKGSQIDAIRSHRLTSKFGMSKNQYHAQSASVARATLRSKTSHRAAVRRKKRARTSNSRFK